MDSDSLSNTNASIGLTLKEEEMKKKYDPGMHTAEHILNQTMIRMFNCGRCFSAHIERKKSKCDYHFNRALIETEISQIEGRVNAVIEADMPVREEFIESDLAAQTYDLMRLPKDIGDEIRIVKIGDYDVCPCIGPHVHSTGGIGKFRIVSTNFENNMLRIRFKLAKANNGHPTS